MNNPNAKLTKVQTEAMRLLTNKWQSQYELGVQFRTLDALVDKGYAKRCVKAGASFPGHRSTLTLYRVNDRREQG